MAELFAYIEWSIWHNRNARKFGTVTMPMEMIYTDAVQRLQEFHSAQDPPLPQEAAPHPTHWLPPPPGFYKINYDGATFQDLASAGLGVVARDSDGRVIAALSERIFLPPTVEALEALACRKAVAFTIDLDIRDVVFEGDSETIFKQLSSDQPSMAALWPLS
uniref:RNase H type-1 domain-containing protein n=1 Tax=Quercus lobata TaxID=97700 RepID=A0A7N2LLQ2_QUELO